MAATIDLHLHTTASDGRCAPEELVRLAFDADIRVMSVTDHDTRAGEPAARAEAARLGMEFVPGIEITSVHEGKDVHVLAYGLASEAPALERLLSRQRQLRLDRAREIASRLERLGVPIDAQALTTAAEGRSGKAIARPQIAALLVSAGHVASVAEAFDRFLDERAPAYVPHQGAAPREVIELVADCGGIASLAHPGQLGKDHVIPTLVEAGLPCIEAYHSSHDEATREHYLALARRLDLAVTGGSDFHGPGTRRAEFFGVVGLPREDLERLRLLLEAGPARTPAHRPE